jgi:cytochrome o ubiquinol oxidase subunit 1
MWILAALGLAATVAAAIIHTFNYKRDYYIPAEEVVVTEAERTRILEAANV